MANPSPTKKFVKGDKRINRKGRPKDFNALRELAQEIAHEELADKRTVVQAIMRKWAGSNDPRLQMAFVEYAYGKVPAPPVDINASVVTTEVTLEEWRKQAGKSRQQAGEIMQQFDDN